ncbi:hypothetical protein FN976_27255 [Caenimonas sedimenti]|uniref:Uncharacterized protein n=1 Tax=Caenimonas sedimenti TaxID=2596921 RepID=A0A562ZEF4_9BURK|nr:hypothetical protein [Caenimonas sedimenti]TWO65507.1 hypothetical protein FN976_27255 [Caenimonas sedimenti]
MGLLSALFGTSQARAGKKPGARVPPASAHPSTFQNSTASGFATSSMLSQVPLDARQQFTVRRDLLRLVLRDTLTRTGIPAGWIEMHALAASSSGKATGVHARFIIRHWNPLLMVHAPGLEQSFVQRLMALDPLADQWVMGFSWQFGLAADAVVAPLPRPGSWTAQPNEPRANLLPMASAAGADVIAGPVHISTRAASTRGAKADLDRLLAEGAADRHGNSAFDTTEPAPLR